MNKPNDNKGFSVVELLIILVVIGALVAVGWLVYKKDHKTNQAVKSTQATVSTVLGSIWTTGTGQQGFGLAKPTTISLGGDASGVLTGIKWQTWGGSKSTGQGTGLYVAQNDTTSQGISAPATVVAFDPGTCSGKSAYTELEWYFPKYGQSFDSNQYLYACTGNGVAESGIPEDSDPYTVISPPYAVLAPATVASKAKECSDTTQQQVGTSGLSVYLTCANGELNVAAWKQAVAFGGPDAMMSLGYNASFAQVCNAYNSDQTTGPTGTGEEDRYQLAAQYYGWNFSSSPIVTATINKC